MAKIGEQRSNQLCPSVSFFFYYTECSSHCIVLPLAVSCNLILILVSILLTEYPVQQCLPSICLPKFQRRHSGLRFLRLRRTIGSDRLVLRRHRKRQLRRPGITYPFRSRSGGLAQPWVKQVGAKPTCGGLVEKLAHERDGEP
jgi:hypothetical protein